MDRNSCLNYFQAFPFWEHMTEEDRNFLLDNIRELHTRQVLPYSLKRASAWELFFF